MPLAAPGSFGLKLAVLDGFSRNLKKYRSELTKSETISKRLKSASKKVGMALTAMSAGSAAAIALTTRNAAKFETQLANVSTMLDKKSLPIMEKYRKELLKMAVEFGESTETLSKGLYDILSASVKPTHALEVLRTSARAAAAGITDTGIAAKAIVTILNSYGLSAEKASEVSDKLFGIVLRGQTTFAELAPAIGDVAATAAIAGLPLDELGATISTVTRAGISTEETMTAIRGVLMAFIKPTDDAKKAAEEFGLELSSTTLRTMGLKGVLELLKDATAEQTAAIFPNVRGLKGMAAALQDAEGFAEDLKLQMNSSGLTLEAFKKQTNTLSYSLNQLKQGVIVLSVQIGELFKPFIREEAEKLKNAVSRLNEVFALLTEEEIKSIGKMILMGTAFAGLAGVFLMLAPGIVSVLGMITSPLGLITLGIAALAIVWIAEWDNIKKALIKVWDKIGPILQDIWNWLAKLAIPWVINLFIEGWERIKGVASWLSEKAKLAWSWLINITQKGWEEIKEIASWLANRMKDGWEWLVNIVQRGWDAIQGISFWLTEKAKSAWEWLVQIFEVGWSNLTKVANWLTEKMKSGWEWAIGIVLKGWEKLQDVASWIKEKSETAWDWIVSIYEKGLSYIKGIASWLSKNSVWAWIVNLLESGYEALKNVAKWIAGRASWNWILNLIYRGFENLQGIAEWLKEKALVGWDWIISLVLKGYEEIKKSATWLSNKTKESWNWITKMVLEGFGEIKKVADWLSEKAKKGWDWVINIVLKGWEGLKRAVEFIESILKFPAIWRKPEKLEDIIEPKTVKNVEKLNEELIEMNELLKRHQNTLTYWGKYWRAASQEIKIAVGQILAEITWMQPGFAKAGFGTAEQFGEGFVREFLSKSKEIQRAIVKAFAAGDIEKALGLLGKKYADAFIYGGSPGMIPGIKEGIPDVQDEFVQGMLQTAKAIAKTSKHFENAMKPILGVFRKVFEKIVDILEATDNKMAKELAQAIKGILKAWDQLFAEIPPKLEGFAKATAGTLGEAIDDASGKIKEFNKDLKKDLEKQKVFTQNIIREIEQFFTSAFQRISMAAEDLLGPVGSLLAGLVGGVFGVGKALVTGDVTSVLSSLLDIVDKFIESFVSLIISSKQYKELQEALNPIIQMIADAYGAIIAPLLRFREEFIYTSEVGEEFKGSLEEISKATGISIEKLQEMADAGELERNKIYEITETLSGLLKPWLDVVAEGMKSLGEFLKDTLQPIFEAIAPLIKTWSEEIKNSQPIIKEFWKLIADFLSPIIRVIINIFKQMTEGGYSFRNLMLGLISLIKAILPIWQLLINVVGFVVQIANAILIPILNILGGLFQLVGSILSRLVYLIKQIWNAFALAVESIIRTATLGLIKLRLPRLEKGGLITDELRKGFLEFQKGGEVPAILHKGELVIPKPITDWIKQAVRTGKSGGSYQAGGLVGGRGTAGSVVFERGAVMIRVQNLNTKADEETLVSTVKEAIAEATEGIIRRS